MRALADALIVLSSFPDPTPDSAVEQASAFCALWDAKLSAVTTILDKHVSFSLGERLTDVPDMMERARERSLDNAMLVDERFERITRQLGVYGDRFREAAPLYAAADQILRHARVHDIVFLPVPDTMILDNLQIAAIVFGAGRPVVLIPAADDGPAQSAVARNVVVAWDFSRAAARALADAMPLLKMAEHVHFCTVMNDKKLECRLPDAHLTRHVELHEVKASFEEIDNRRGDVGATLTEFVVSKSADLLVMGAFGHSRMVEFVLGGATRSILNKPAVPIFLSH